jgi:shikimate dehydrogenase
MNFTNIVKNKINLKNNQKFVAIIGAEPSKGARSPVLWNKAFSKFKINMKMFPLDVKSENVGRLIKSLKENDYFSAAAVTVPYKERVIKYLDEIDQSALEIGSVNLIVKKNNKLRGYNTDSLGCIFILHKIKKIIKNILIIGCGGAGRACIISAKNKYPKANIYLFNRDLKKLNKFYTRIKVNKKKIKIIKNYSIFTKLKKLDLIINTTSLGSDLEIPSIKSNLKYFSPISQSEIKFNKLKTTENVTNTIVDNLFDTLAFLKANSNAIVFDIIYKPSKTIIIKIAEKIGLKSINGLEMNFVQAVEAFRIVNQKVKIKEIIKAMK